MTKLSYTECPKGHKLPRTGCTPLFCCGEQVVPLPVATKENKRRAKQGDSKAKNTVKKKVTPHLRALAEAELAKAPTGKHELAATPESPLPEEVEKYQLRLGKRVAERAVRMALLQTPEGLKGADAEEWADTKAVELLPQALAQIEYDLKYGDDGQRREAARDILDMTGRRRRDGAVAAAPTIVLNLAGSGHLLPFEKLNAQVTTGTATRVEAGQDGAAANGPPRALEADAGRGPSSS